MNAALVAAALLAVPAPRTLVAACDADTALLVAEWAPDGTFRALRGEFSRDAPRAPFPAAGKRLKQELQRYARSLRTARWFGADGRPAKTVFAPRLHAEETDACVERTTDLRLELGPCPAEGGWFGLTAALRPVRPEPLQADARARAVAARLGVGRVDQLEVRRVPGPVPLVEVRFSGAAAASASVPDADGTERKVPMLVDGWALLGAGDEPLASRVEHAHDPEAPLPQDYAAATGALGDVAWARLAADPAVRIAVVPFSGFSGGRDGDSSGESGYVVVRVAADGSVRVETLVVSVNEPC